MIKMKNLRHIKILIFLLLNVAISNRSNSQSDISGTLGIGHQGGNNTGYYVGWDGNTTFDLNIVHNAVGQNINFTTTTGAGTTQKATILANGNFGIGTVLPTAIIGINGNVAQTIKMEIPTTTSTAGHNLTIQSGSSSAGTDLAGGNLLLKSGASTGTISSQIQFYTATGSGTPGTAKKSSENMICMLILIHSPYENYRKAGHHHPGGSCNRLPATRCFN